jgi:1-acyl-sn-glycerol-3-phosphate acyltransferase
MTESTPHAAAGAMRVLRYAWRVPWLLLHVLVLLPLTVLLISLPTARLRWGDGRLDDRLIRAWSAGLMRVFGFHLYRFGEPLHGATLFVANHVSWSDIVLLHSQRMMGFVAKREIAGWPVVGWMASRAETIFHQRGSTESLGGVLHAMLARLRAGRSVAVFPEGRTRDGREIGPFHARIFLAAVESGAPVQPVAICYGVHCAAQAVVAFHGREGFLGNFLRLLGEPARVADVRFLEPIPAGSEEGRRRIAELARERIVAAMQ